MSIIFNKKLEEILLSNWTLFFNHKEFLKKVFEDVKKANLPKSLQTELPNQNFKLSLTKMEVKDNTNFELWAEFSVPTEEGVAVGTNVYFLDLKGNIKLHETYGHIFIQYP